MPSRFKNAKPYVWPTLEDVRAERLRSTKKQPRLPERGSAPAIAATAVDASAGPRGAPFAGIDVQAPKFPPAPREELPKAGSSSRGDHPAGIGDWN